MGAGHGHGHAGGRHRWRLAVAFALVAAFFGVELAVGLVSGSLALISDAGHMAADVVALGAALVATKIATRPDGTGRRTYGSYRAEVFASGFTVLIMLGVSVYVVVEAIGRIGDSVEVASGPMLVVGALGLVINLVVPGAAARRRARVDQRPRRLPRGDGRRRGQRRGPRRRGARRPDRRRPVGHRRRRGDRRLRRRACGMLGRQVLAVLGQHAPEDVDLDAVVRDLEEVPGVAEVHDLHAWTLTSGMNVATAHLVLRVGADSQSVLAGAQATLRDGHGIEHATLQVEVIPARECHEATW